MGGTTVAAAAARASRVCWTCWEGNWGEGPDLVPTSCAGWLTLGGQGFYSLYSVWGWLSVNLKSKLKCHFRGRLLGFH